MRTNYSESRLGKKPKLEAGTLHNLGVGKPTVGEILNKKLSRYLSVALDVPIGKSLRKRLENQET